MSEMDIRINGVKYVPEVEYPKDKSVMSALEVRFSSDAGDGLTVRDYLKTLLMTLWIEGEGFSGKRPFGNSGWDYELYAPLIAAGFITGSLDEEGFIQEVDDDEAYSFVRDLIVAAFYGVKE